MTSKTKIIVLQIKEILRTGILIGLGILVVLLIIAVFGPDKKQPPAGTDASGENSDPASPSRDTPEESLPTSYIPGVYSTALVLGDHVVDVEVIVDYDNINSIRLVNLDEAVATMYPLLQPTFDFLAEQICEKQSLENITYTEGSKYTSLVLLQAIESSLKKADTSLPNL